MGAARRSCGSSGSYCAGGTGGAGGTGWPACPRIMRCIGRSVKKSSITFFWAGSRLAYRSPAALAMVFMLVKSAERRWRKLNGIPRLAQVIEGVHFKDGVREDVEKIAT